MKTLLTAILRGLITGLATVGTIAIINECQDKMKQSEKKS